LGGGVGVVAKEFWSIFGLFLVYSWSILFLCEKAIFCLVYFWFIFGLFLVCGGFSRLVDAVGSGGWVVGWAWWRKIFGLSLVEIWSIVGLVCGMGKCVLIK
jgi:hypothetical protein